MMVMADWQSIETAPKGEVLLYFPATPQNRSGRGGMSEMFRVGHAIHFPFRRPTHWLKLPEPPEAQP
jgi:hypothetical protein